MTKRQTSGCTSSQARVAVFWGRPSPSFTAEQRAKSKDQLLMVRFITRRKAAR